MSGINVRHGLKRMAENAAAEGDVVDIKTILEISSVSTVNLSGSENQIVIEEVGDLTTISISPSSNGYGTRYVSTNSPSGYAQDGDIWLQTGTDSDISLFQTDNVTGAGASVIGHLQVTINGVNYKLAIVS